MLWILNPSNGMNGKVGKNPNGEKLGLGKSDKYLDYVHWVIYEIKHRIG